MHSRRFLTVVEGANPHGIGVLGGELTDSFFVDEVRLVQAQDGDTASSLADSLSASISGPNVSERVWETVEISFPRSPLKASAQSTLTSASLAASSVEAKECTSWSAALL